MQTDGSTDMDGSVETGWQYSKGSRPSYPEFVLKMMDFVTKMMNFVLQVSLTFRATRATTYRSSLAWAGGTFCT